MHPQHTFIWKTGSHNGQKSRSNPFAVKLYGDRDVLVMMHYFDNFFFILDIKLTFCPNILRIDRLSLTLFHILWCPATFAAGQKVLRKELMPRICTFECQQYINDI